MKDATSSGRYISERFVKRRATGEASTLGRRVFLKLGGVGGLALGWGCATDDAAPADASEVGPSSPDAGVAIERHGLNAYVRIGSDENVYLYIGQSEMGQGVLTSLAMLIAEELDVDWAKVQAEHPIASFERYGNQATVGSTSVAAAFVPMRQVGAAARQMLLAAAGQRWQVSASELRSELGAVTHDASGRRATYGELAELAATLTPPEPPEEPAPLASDTALRIIGTPRRQLLAREKASGVAKYTIDVTVDGMLVGLTARPPTFGGTLQNYDASATLAVPGVRQVVEIPAGVAVLADHFWAALQGRNALVVQWNAGPHAALSSAGLSAMMTSVMGQGSESLLAGDPEQLFAASPDELRLDVTYELPYLAHAPLEPLNAIADVRSDAVEIWAGTQMQTVVVNAVAQATGVPDERVTLHVPLLGGGFGRRLSEDYVMDAVHASRAVARPVKMMYTREDEIRSGLYRPMSVHRLRGAIDADGQPRAWMHDIVVKSIIGEFAAVEGAATNFPYAMANRRVTWRDSDEPISVFFWRSVGASHNAFVVESFLDELAALGGKDPVELRLELLTQSKDPNALRHTAVLRDVVERSGWRTPAPAGRARGIAMHATFGTIVAEVAEVSIEDHRVRVHRVWTTVDCGRAVNPLGVEAQVEGSIMFGLSAALYGRIDIEAGAVVQSNFDTYRLLRMSEAPQVETAIIDSGAPVTGMGEPAVPPIAPAVCNAIFRLTGQRMRRLPIQLSV